MRHLSRKSSIALIAIPAIVLAAIVVLVNSALATPGLGTAFIARYPDLRETPLDNCGTCHMPAKDAFLNDYGIALRDAKMDFAKVEPLDSDGDGYTNIDEINEEGYPGSQATSPEYFIFHVLFSANDAEVGKVHFNHEMHTIKESFLSKGRCNTCHGRNQFPKVFDDNKSVRELAHQLCWRCHETSGSKLAPKDCSGCHTGIEDIVGELKGFLKDIEVKDEVNKGAAEATPPSTP